jgi:hypothetical protein
MKPHQQLNIKRRTSNDIDARRKGVRRSMWDVGCWMFSPNRHG